MRMQALPRLGDVETGDGCGVSDTVSVAELLAAHRVEVVPRIAVGAEDAAAALGLSRDTFDEYVAPHVRVIRVGRRKLYRLTELNRWAEASEAKALE